MTLVNILSSAILFLIVLIVILAIVYFSMNAKEKQPKNKKNSNNVNNAKEKSGKPYTKESIFKFMEFDKIEDNMIIQKNGKKFLMAIECQGINYDLMSDVEKTSVESGFIQFLNTLRNPIQIYIQTRTINLEDSLKKYKEKLQKIEDELKAKQNKYKAMIESGNYTEKQITDQEMEVRRQSNLFEYGKDIIFNTERISKNKNVLRKKYYLIVSYYSDSDNELLKDYEIKEMAFSDLYIKCQSLIRALSVSGVNGRILNSYELVDLLYNAYNRDESENFGLERAEKAGFDSLYVTAQDVLEKRIKAINEKINEEALDLAEESIKYANEALEKEIKEKEKSYDELVAELANELVEENKDYFPEEVVEEAKKQIRKTKEASKNAKKERKTK